MSSHIILCDACGMKKGLGRYYRDEIFAYDKIMYASHCPRIFFKKSCHNIWIIKKDRVLLHPLSRENGAMV